MYRSAFGEFDSEKAEQFYLAGLRRMTIEQRWGVVAGLRQIAVDMVRAQIRAAHTDWTERQIKVEATRRIMDAHGISFRTTGGIPVRH